MFRKILIANDGSAGGAKALAAAIELARIHKAALHMISVEELPRYPATIDEVVEEKVAANHLFVQLIERAKTQAKSAHVKFEGHIVTGHAVSSIVDFIAHEGCDLLVVGFMGHSALYNRVIGSTTDRLVELAPCPVLVIK
jgi:nucleotide-binding universal stress UspA family protein